MLVVDFLSRFRGFTSFSSSKGLMKYGCQEEWGSAFGMIEFKSRARLRLLFGSRSKQTGKCEGFKVTLGSLSKLP